MCAYTQCIQKDSFWSLGGEKLYLWDCIFRRHKIVIVLIIFHLKFKIGFWHGADLFSHIDAAHTKDIL